MIPEQRLLTECINRHIIAAIWPFKIPGESIPSIEEQYDKLLNQKKPVIFYNTTSTETYRSIRWLEKSHFDEFAQAADLGQRFVDKSFEFVQKCIYLRNKLLREQIANGKVKPVAQHTRQVKK